MRARLLIPAVLFLFVLSGSCPARAGTPVLYEAENLPNGELLTPGGGGDYYVYSPNGGTVGGLIFVATAGDTLTIGSSGGTPELGLPTRFSAGDGMFVDVGSTGRVAAPAGAAGGTEFFIGSLSVNQTGTFIVEPGIDSTPAGRNRVIVQDLEGFNDPLSTSRNLIIVKDRAELQIRSPGYTSRSFTFELAGGDMSFADSLTLQAGSVTATAGSSTLAVGGGLTLDWTNQNFSVAPVVRVRGGAELTLLREPGGTDAADLTLANGAGLDIQNGGVLTTGTVRFTQPRDLGLTPMQAGTVNARRLEFTTLADAAGLAWHVSGAAAFSGDYTVKGTANTYGAVEMAAGAVLTSDTDADTAITVGTGDSPGEITVAGGTVRAGAGRRFTISGARIVLAGAPASGAVLDAGAGRLDLSGSSVLVDAGPDAVMAFDGAAGMEVGEYDHRAGTVEVSGAEGFAVTGGAVVGGGGAAKFIANGDAAHFARGLALRAGGILAAGAGGGAVTLGGDLTLAGVAVLDGGAGGLRLAAAAGAGAAAPIVRVTAGGNIVRGAVSTELALRVSSPGAELTLDGGVLEAGPVTIERGGMYAVGAGGVIRNGAGGLFTVGRDGAIGTTSAGLAITGYDGVVLDGSFTVGWDGAGAAALTADSDVTLGPAAAIHFTDELLANITPGPDAVVIALSGDGRTITAEGDLSINSIFGSVGMTAGGGELAVTSIGNRIKADSSPEDIALAAGNMRAVWGTGQIPAELAGLAYAAAVTGNGRDGFPDSADAAGRNRALLLGLANPSGVAVGLDTVEFMNGAAAAKVDSAGLMAAMAVTEHVSSRARELRRLSASGESAGGGGEVASGVALPSVAGTNAAPAPVGGVYFAGLRVWDRQDGGDGFSGYEYDAHGFLLGYDRALADNIAVGASFAYYQGGYADAGSLASASSLDGCALAAYGVYSPEGGFFASASAGYARFDNAVLELRSDPSSPAGASWASAGYDSGVLTLGIDAGFDYNPADYLTLTPSVGLLYLRSAADDHAALLSGVATQRESGISSSALLFPLRMAGRYEAGIGAEGRLVLTASLGYTFNAMRSHSGRVWYSGLSPSVPAVARALPRHSFTAGVGARFVYRCFDFGLDYSFSGGDGRAAHRLAGTVGTVF